MSKAKCKKCKKIITGKIAYYKSQKYDSECYNYIKNNSLNKSFSSKLEAQYSYLQAQHRKILQELDTFIGNKTLKQYDLLRKAYKIGKKLDKTFTHKKLSDDFGISLKHCKRLLSLSKLTSTNWAYVKSGKVSANKASIVTFEKPLELQTEIFRWIILNKPTNEEIHQYRTLSTISQEAYERDMEKVRKQIYLLTKYLNSNIKPFPKNFVNEIKPKLETLKELIDEYLKL